MGCKRKAGCGYKKMIALISLMLLVNLCNGCISDDDKPKSTVYWYWGCRSVSISPDDSEFIFTYYHNGTCGIYRADIDGRNVTKLISSKEYEYYGKYIPDGSKINFLQAKLNSTKPPYYHIKNFIMNRDGTNIQEVNSSYMTPSAKSPKEDPNTMYYLKKVGFHESPVEGGLPIDEYEVFSSPRDHFEEKQITNLNISESVSFDITSNGSELYIFSGFDEFIVRRCSIKNGTVIESYPVIPGLGAGDIQNPQLSKFNSSILFITRPPSNSPGGSNTLEMFCLNTTTKTISQLTDKKNLGPRWFWSFEQFNIHKKMFVIDCYSTPQPYKNGDSRDCYYLYVMNYDGTGLEEVQLDVPE